MVSVIIARETPFSRRHHKRRVNVSLVRVGSEALASGEWVYHCEHGGDVANSYGYAVDTECLVAVASPDGVVVAWYGAAPANKVTLTGAAHAATGDVDACKLWDLRCRDIVREYARWRLRRLHAEASGGPREPFPSIADKQGVVHRYYGGAVTGCERTIRNGRLVIAEPNCIACVGS